MSKPAAKHFADYAARFPAPIRRRLSQMRRTIKKAAPQAEETISYKMPAYKLNGMLVWFAGFKNHIGLYPRVDAHATQAKPAQNEGLQGESWPSEASRKTRQRRYRLSVASVSLHPLGRNDRRN